MSEFTEEMLDVVDQDDVVIRQETRSRVHKQQLMHRATHIILCDSENRVFLQLRSKSKDTNPGLWDTSAAGHVDAGEAYLACAVRELHEELGVTLEPQDLTQVGQMSPSAQNGFEFVRIYLARSDQAVTLEPGEIDDGKWLSEAQLAAWLTEEPDAFTDTFKIIWQHYQQWVQSGSGALS